jgi:selT/selW/selH-like putative selenoprotein
MKISNILFWILVSDSLTNNSRICLMKVEIHYCPQCQYKGIALGLEGELRRTFGAKSKFVEESNGTFDVIVDGKLVFSKFELGRLPEPGEIADKLRQ